MRVVPMLINERRGAGRDGEMLAVVAAGLRFVFCNPLSSPCDHFPRPQGRLTGFSGLIIPSTVQKSCKTITRASKKKIRTEKFTAYHLPRQYTCFESGARAGPCRGRVEAAAAAACCSCTLIS